MLQRNILWKARSLRGQINSCIYFRYAAFHRSRPISKRPQQAEVLTIARHSFRRTSACGITSSRAYAHFNNRDARNESEPHATNESEPHAHPRHEETGLEYGDLEPNAPTPDRSVQSGKNLLEVAYTQGILQIKPELVASFLEQLSRFGTQLDPTNLRNTCASFGISVDAAYTLARLLIRCPGPLDRYQGRQILLQASALGSAKATLFVVRTARQLESQALQPVLKHLQQLAAHEPPIIPARVAQANLYSENGEYNAAQELYRKVIDNVPSYGNSSRIGRWMKQLKRSHVALEPTAMVEEKNITVEETDTDLDVAGALMGLANIQYHITHDQEEALRNWELAALEYDDPVAYYNIATHFETVAKTTNKDKLNPNDPLEHDWLCFVPYKWFEYMMKAAASGHPEACYKIGLFYLLDRQGYTDDIADTRLRQVLKKSPLTQAQSGTIKAWVRGSSTKLDRHQDRNYNQAEIIHRWLVCGAKSGSKGAVKTLELAQLRVPEQADSKGKYK